MPKPNHNPPGYGSGTGVDMRMLEPCVVMAPASGQTVIRRSVDDDPKRARFVEALLRKRRETH